MPPAPPAQKRATGPTGPAVPLNALYAVNTGSQTLSSTGDPATFTTNEVEEGTAITHSPSSSDIELTEPGTYRITYSAVATNTSSTGNVGLELQEDDGTAIDGSESTGKVNSTNDPTPLGASVLLTVPGTRHHHPQRHREQHHPQQRGHHRAEAGLNTSGRRHESMPPPAKLPVMP